MDPWPPGAQHRHAMPRQEGGEHEDDVAEGARPRDVERAVFGAEELGRPIHDREQHARGADEKDAEYQPPVEAWPPGGGAHDRGAAARCRRSLMARPRPCSGTAIAAMPRRPRRAPSASSVRRPENKLAAASTRSRPALSWNTQPA